MEETRAVEKYVVLEDGFGFFAFEDCADVGIAGHYEVGQFKAVEHRRHHPCDSRHLMGFEIWQIYKEGFAGLGMAQEFEQPGMVAVFEGHV